MIDQLAIFAAEVKKVAREGNDSDTLLPDLLGFTRHVTKLLQTPLHITENIPHHMLHTYWSVVIKSKSAINPVAHNHLQPQLLELHNGVVARRQSVQVPTIHVAGS